MPRERPTSPTLPPVSQSHAEFSKLADRQRELRVAEFDANLRFMAERFMARRGSRTLDATDVDAAHAWLTRPSRKAVARDLIASVVVLLAAVVVA